MYHNRKLAASIVLTSSVNYSIAYWILCIFKANYGPSTKPLRGGFVQHKAVETVASNIKM